MYDDESWSLVDDAGDMWAYNTGFGQWDPVYINGESYGLNPFRGSLVGFDAYVQIGEFDESRVFVGVSHG